MAIYKGDGRFILFNDFCIGEIQYVVPYKSKKLYSVHVYSKGGYYLEFTSDKLDKFKRANSIDELCQAFVMFCPNARARPIRIYQNMNTISHYCKLDNKWQGTMVDKVYGAIWTSKGLIYIASYDKTTGTFVPIDVGNI